MLHRCKSCSQHYLVSEFMDLCNPCGQQQQSMIEQLYESDNAIEWITLLSRIHNPQQPEVKRRWTIG